MKRKLSIFVAGLAVRLVVVAYIARLKPPMLPWGPNEAGAIARWLVTTHSFSSPFHDAYGPTAWLGPIYPLIVAAFFLLFGSQTSASALAVVIFNSVCSAATGIVVYEMGKELNSEEAGLFGGWIWAFSLPLAILPFLKWDTCLSALMLGGGLLLTVRLSTGKSRQWAGCGATWGVAALVNPALVAPLPVLALLLLKSGRKWRQVLVMIAIVIVVVTPWTVRNYLVFHRLLPIRSNGLTEVYFANCGFETHPLRQSMEYQRLGEAAFTAQANGKAVEYLSTHPAAFLRDSIHRAILFWIYPMYFWPISVGIDLTALFGLVVLLRKARVAALILIATLALYPLVYYASQVVARYRHPIEPVLYALSGIALATIRMRLMARWGNVSVARLSEEG